MTMKSSSAAVHSPDQDRPWKDDPAKWPLAYAKAVVISCDWGFGHDRAALAAVSRWDWLGQPYFAVQRLTRFELETPPADVVAEIGRAINDYSWGTAKPTVVVDSRSNAAFFAMTAAAGWPSMPVGISATGAASHNLQPQRITVRDAQGKPKGALVYSLSRTAMIDEMVMLTQQQRLAVTETGDHDALMQEMDSLQVEITKARNRVFVTPPGQHDDCISAVAMGIWGATTLQGRYVKAPVRKKSKPSVLAWG